MREGDTLSSRQLRIIRDCVELTQCFVTRAFLRCHDCCCSFVDASSFGQPSNENGHRRPPLYQVGPSSKMPSICLMSPPQERSEPDGVELVGEGPDLRLPADWVVVRPESAIRSWVIVFLSK
jgi:hypothetical protein